MTPNALADHRRTDSAQRQAAVRVALTQMTQAGEFITASAVARRAGVHRSLVYRHPDLQALIDAAKTDTPQPQRDDQITAASLNVTIENERARNRRLNLRIAQLERRLSEAIGREAFRDSGLANADETSALEKRVLDLESDNADLRRQLREAATELEAAHHVNTRLTRQLNKPADEAEL